MTVDASIVRTETVHILSPITVIALLCSEQGAGSLLKVHERTLRVRARRRISRLFRHRGSR